MKINKTIKILVFITLFALVIISCNKNEINPDNLSNGKSTAVFNSDLTYGTVVDRDGNEYKTIVIGTQTWMAENLRTTMYNDGSDIPLVTDNTEWSVLTTPAYCNYNNSTNLDTIGTYGRLYNGYAVSKDICPTGWHVPNGDDWAILMQSLTSEEFAGGKMKEAGTTHWYDPNYYANNESGFTALPAGWRRARCHDSGFEDARNRRHRSPETGQIHATRDRGHYSDRPWVRNRSRDLHGAGCLCILAKTGGYRSFKQDAKRRQ